MNARNVAVAASIAFLAASAAAQANVAQSAAQTVQVVQSRAQNAALLKQYTWTERLDFMVNGQQKDLRLELCNFGPDGKLQRTVLNDQSAPLPGGFFRRKIAENKRKDVETYLKGLGELLRQYTLPTAGAVLDFMDSAATTPGPGGQVLMTGQNVVQPGDSMTIWVDAMTKKTRKVAVSTSFQGNPVNLTATFKTLPNGLNYPAYADLTVPPKGYTILVQNFDYQMNGM